MPTGRRSLPVVPDVKAVLLTRDSEDEPGTQIRGELELRQILVFTQSPLCISPFCEPGRP